MIDYWVKLGPYMVFVIGVYALGAFGARWSSASFTLWQAYCGIIFILSAIAIANRAWRLQAPLAVRPLFAHLFSGLFHGWIAVLLGIGTVIAYRELWALYWSVAWFFGTQLVNYIVVAGINALYARSRFYHRKQTHE